MPHQYQSTVMSGTAPGADQTGVGREKRKDKLRETCRRTEIGWTGISDREASGAWKLRMFIICTEQTGKSLHTAKCGGDYMQIDKEAGHGAQQIEVTVWVGVVSVGSSPQVKYPGTEKAVVDIFCIHYQHMYTDQNETLLSF